jgi:hypothetical protein
MPSGGPGILPPTQDFDGSLIDALHGEPRGGMVMEIMKPEVSDPGLTGSPVKGHSGFGPCPRRERSKG